MKKNKKKNCKGNKSHNITSDFPTAKQMCQRNVCSMCAVILRIRKERNPLREREREGEKKKKEFLINSQM